MATVESMYAKKNTYTNRASEISRTLCLSGLAVVWLFRTPTNTGSALEPALIWISGLLVLALLVDLVQYVAGAVKTGRVARALELQLSEEGKAVDTVVKYPEDHPKLMSRLWNLEVTLVIIAWSVLVVFVAIKAIAASLPLISR
jgi:hypothetical protein